MEILFLGTGSAFTREYNNTNLWLNFSGENLLIDAGTTCTRSMEKVGLNPSQIRNIFITHLHADHIGGLEEIALKTKYVFHNRIHLYIPFSLAEDLWAKSLAGGLEYTVEGKVGIEYYFEPHSVEKTFSVGDTVFEIIPTLHIPGMPSYGLFFEGVFFTNDTVFDRRLIYKMNEKARIIIHDCSFIPNPVHAYYRELLTLPREIREKIYLIHYTDGSEDKQQEMIEAGFKIAKNHHKLKIIEEQNL